MKGDFQKAEKFLIEVIKMPFAYKDLIARAKLDLADIAAHPKAIELLKEVHQMEGLDPYLIEKASMIEQALKEKKTSRFQAKAPKKKALARKKVKKTTAQRREKSKRKK